MNHIELAKKYFEQKYHFGFEIIGTRKNALRYQDGTYADEYLMVKNL